MLGHKCKNKQLYLLIVQDEEMTSDEELESEKATTGNNDQVISNKPYLSLHALEGTFNYQTIRVRGISGEKDVVCAY